MSVKESLSGKRIVVVGGGGLLGASICEAIVSAGARCIIADISRVRAEAVANAIQHSQGDRPDVLEVSINEEASVEAMVADCDSRMGGIDGLLNTAYPRNIRYGQRFENVKYEDFCENVNLHLGGYFLVSQRILEYFKRQGGGVLLNISSIYGVVAPRFQVYEATSMTMPVEYAAVKSAIVHLTRYMAKYYAGHGIRVNCLSLGGLKDKQPEDFLKRYRENCLDKGMLDPEDVIGSIVFLMSDSSRYVNGQNLIVDDGFTL